MFYEGVQYIVPLIGTSVAGSGMMLAALPIETYLVDGYKIRGASAIAAGVIFRATTGAFLPLIGPQYVYRDGGLYMLFATNIRAMTQVAEQRRM